MNTEQLQCVIRENSCFSSDTLPKYVTSYPSAFVCNSQESRLPGEHWVVFGFKTLHMQNFLIVLD